VAVSHKGHLLASGTDDGRLTLWPMQTLTQARQDKSAKASQ
jgi:hypothetical protein